MLANNAFKWIALGLAIPVLLTVSLNMSYQESSSAGVIVPGYVPLTFTDDWNDLFSAEDNHPRVSSVLIFNCGDPGGPCPFNPAIQDKIDTAKSKGMKTIGYVATGYGSRDPLVVESEINMWETEYDGIEGIFFDEMKNTAGSETYYSEQTAFVKAKPTMDFTVGNPGADTIPSYIPTVDHIVIHETCSMPTLQRLDDWHADYDKSHFSYMVHSQTTPPDWAFVSNSANHVAYMYITDETFGDGISCPLGLNPWDKISNYIETLYATLDVPSVNITVESKNMTGNTITPSNSNIELKANNVMVRKDTSPLFYNATSNTSYTITALDFGTFVFDHWEDSSTNPTRVVTPTVSTTYTAFYEDTSIPPPPANYVVDLLDVYQSSSPTLDSGTAVCLDVDLETASSCAGMLNAGATYRFEIEVQNDGGATSPTTFEFRDVINTNDVLGTIPVGNILDSGCSTNADWTESVVTDDARISSGTTCLIGTGGSAEFWMVITIDTDANNGTGTFFVSDGTVSDTSTATTFTVNPPQQVSLNVNSSDLSGGEITGMWVELWKDGQQIETGFTPFSTTVQADVEHTVIAGSFQQTIFDHWEDESTSETRPFTITQDANFTAFYQTGSTIALNNVQTTSGTVSLFPYQFALANFNAGTGIDRLLVVGVEANNNWVTSITFGGVHLTQKVQSFNSNDAEFWYLTNPTGTADIVVTMSGPTSAVIGAYSFSGVDQANPVPTSATNIGSGNPTISLTTVYPNSWVLDSPSIWGGVTLDSPTCTSQWNINVPNAITGASSSAVQTSPGLVTCSWTASSVDNWDDVAIEVKTSE